MHQGSLQCLYMKPHNVISFRIFWLDISQTEIIKGVEPLRREADTRIYVGHFAYDDTREAHGHITDFELRTCIKKSSFRGKNITDMFIKLSHHRGFAHETTACLGDSMVYLCFYLFIFFLTCSLEFLGKKKEVVLGKLKVLH